MKAISLTQPWATLIAIGAKAIETRSWRTEYRGPLAIHAAKGLGPVGGQRGLQGLCSTEPFCSVLNAAMKAWDTPPKSLREMVERPFMPLGAIVAVCDLISCEETDPDGWPGPGRYSFGNRSNSDCRFVLEWPVPEPERSFGDYSPGRFMWLLANVRPLPKPIPAKGALGLWEWADARRTSPPGDERH